MAEEKAVATTGQDVDLAEWRTRQEVVVMGKRIKALLPGGDKLSDGEAMSLAQYSLAMGANPFRGEVYGFRGRNGFQIVEGYKLLSRWAQRQCPFTEKYQPTPQAEVPDGAIGIRCYVLRDDKKKTMREFIEMGANFKEAYDLCATFADGIVESGDLGRKPPTGWTWEQVARKRALKNVLNLTHGAPSLKEIAAQSWDVNGRETQPQDWDAVTPGMSRDEAEAVAEYGAMAREAHEHAGDVTAQQAADELFGDYVDDENQPQTEEMVDPGVVLEGESAAVVVPNWVNDADLARRFYIWANKQVLPNGETITKPQIYEAIGVESSLKQFTGTIGDAKTKVNAWIKAQGEQATE